MEEHRRVSATRRALLGAVAATTAGLAGCSGPDDGGGGDEGNDGGSTAAKVSLSFARTAEKRAKKRQRAYGRFREMFSAESTLAEMKADARPGIIDILENLGVTDIYENDPPVGAMDAVDAAPTPGPVDLLQAAVTVFELNEDVGVLHVLRTGSMQSFDDEDAYPGEAEAASDRNGVPASDDAGGDWAGGLAAKAEAVESAASRYRDEESTAAADELVAALRAEYRACVAPDGEESLPELREWGNVDTSAYQKTVYDNGAKVIKRAARANVNAILGFRAKIGGRLEAAGIGITPTPAPTATPTGAGTETESPTETPTGERFTVTFDDRSAVRSLAVGDTIGCAGLVARDSAPLGWAATVYRREPAQPGKFVARPDDSGAAVTDVAAAPNGDFVLGGVVGSDSKLGYDAAWLVRMDVDGNPRWSRILGRGPARDDGYIARFDAVHATDDGVLAAGRRWSENRAITESLLVATDWSGTEQWRRTYTLDTRGIRAIAPHERGYLLGGGIPDGEGIGTALVDGTGRLQSGQAYSREGSEVLMALVPAAEGYLAVTNRQVDGEVTGWLVRVEADGDFAWRRRAPDAGIRFGDVVAGSNRHLVVGAADGRAALAEFGTDGTARGVRPLSLDAERAVGTAIERIGSDLVAGGFRRGSTATGGWLRRFSPP